MGGKGKETKWEKRQRRFGMRTMGTLGSERYGELKREKKMMV